MPDLSVSFFILLTALGWLNHSSQNVERRRVDTLPDRTGPLFVVSFSLNILFKKIGESSTASLTPVGSLQSALLRWPLTHEISRFLIEGTP